MAYGHGRRGYYRYGYSENPGLQRDETDSKYNRKDTGPTPEESFGAGIALATEDDNEEFAWDLVIDSSGAFAATRGVDELAKDVAFKTAQEYHNLLGGLINVDTLSDIEVEIEDIVAADDRVTSVEKVEARKSGVDMIDVSLQFIAKNDEVHEHVFPLSVT